MKEQFLNLKKKAVALAKHAVYGHSGEPYLILGHKLNFPIGSRPVRFNYVHSKDRLAQEEVLALAVVLAQLREGDVALDIGAHSGVYSALMASRCGQTGCVVAFEPDPAAVLQFDATFSLNPTLKRPKLKRIACAENNGTAQFFASCGDSRSSFKHGRPESAKAIEVETVKLDDFLEANALQPRLVKIDVEGAEISVLRGAERLLNSDCTIICELHPFAWQRFGTSFDELLEIVGMANRTIRYLGEIKETSANPVYGLTIIER